MVPTRHPPYRYTPWKVKMGKSKLWRPNVPCKQNLGLWTTTHPLGNTAWDIFQTTFLTSSLLYVLISDFRAALQLLLSSWTRRLCTAWSSRKFRSRAFGQNTCRRRIGPTSLRKKSLSCPLSSIQPGVQGSHRKLSSSFWKKLFLTKMHFVFVCLWTSYWMSLTDHFVSLQWKGDYIYYSVAD